jgi:hypothetical protein
MSTLFIHIRKSLLTALLGGASLVSLANGNGPISGGPVSGGNSANTAQVKYVTVEGEGIFNVTYNNAAGNRFSVVVLDGDGDQLYSNVFSDKNFDKNFRLADPDSYHKIVFVIRNLNDNTTQRFEAEASGHEVEEVDVKELK